MTPRRAAKGVAKRSEGISFTFRRGGGKATAMPSRDEQNASGHGAIREDVLSVIELAKACGIVRDAAARAPVAKYQDNVASIASGRAA